MSDDTTAPATPKTRKRGKAAKVYAPGSLEAFTVKKIHRSLVKNAAYNPRFIRDDERARLKAIIEHLKLLGPITWNERSGNIVGGHQRVSLMDDLYGTQDYELTVAAVDLSDSEEVEANLALNNISAQGDTDMDKLAELLRTTDGLRVEATGFDMAELYKLFGDSPFAVDAVQTDALADMVRDAKEKFANIAKLNKERDVDDFYLVVVFRSYAERKAFTDEHGIDDNRYVAATTIARLIVGE